MRETCRVRLKTKHLVQPVAFAAFLAAQLGSIFHLGLVRHEVCEDHGELVEATSSAADHHAPSSGATSERHEHCPLLVTSAHARTSAPIELVAPVMYEFAAEPSGASASEPTISVSVLSFAPKTSPPA